MLNIVRPIIQAVLYFTILSNLRAGTLTVTTVPASTSSSDGSQYNAISKYDAGATGITFSSTNMTSHGSVTAWSWIFSNGSPGTSSVQSPGKVTFGTSAYGLSNSCTVGLNHLGSSGESCAVSSKVVSTVHVNVIKPTLVFKTTGTWTTGDTAYTACQTAYAVTLTIGTKAEFKIPKTTGPIYATCPYEYGYTITPSNSGATSSKMAIYETNSLDEKYYQGTTLKSDHPSSLAAATYNPAGFYNYTSVTAPANPIMYACDTPGWPESVAQNNMATNGYNKYVATTSLTSYPLYNDASAAHLDSTTLKTHLFTYVCTSSNTNGTGTYTWTAIP